jgi:hypothetical protein
MIILLSLWIILLIIYKFCCGGLIKNHLGDIIYSDCLLYDKDKLDMEEYYNTKPVLPYEGKEVQINRIEDKSKIEYDVAKSTSRSKISLYPNDPINIIENSPNNNNATIGIDNTMNSTKRISKSRNLENSNNIDIKLESTKTASDMYHEKTIKDYTTLTPTQIAKYDNRSFSTYLRDYLMRIHPFFYVFIRRSLMEPIAIRINLLITIINILFGVNALLFTDSIIEDRAYSAINERKDFFINFGKDFGKSILSIVISSVFINLLYFLCRIPKDKEENFNAILRRRDRKEIEEN